MPDRFDGGDESRVQALMAENDRLNTALDNMRAEYLANLNQTEAEVKRLRLIIREHGLSDGYA